MHGGIVYVKDKAVAMTLGCEISPIAFDICFEKALREYDGIYAVINNEFAKTLSSYKYINREEDMGIEGLKKSKLSYNPIILIARYNATLKMMEINFCKPDNFDIKSLKKLWLSSFDEEPKAVDLFLTNVLTQNKLILQSTAKNHFRTLSYKCKF